MDNEQREDLLAAVDDACSHKMLRHLSNVIHSLNRQWWPDHPVEDDNEVFKASRIALMHSELSECLEGMRKGLLDNHLSQHPMEDVELADTLIRIFDYCGRYDIPIDEIIRDKLEYNANRADHKLEHRQAEGGKKI